MLVGESLSGGRRSGPRHMNQRLREMQDWILGLLLVCPRVRPGNHLDLCPGSSNPIQTPATRYDTPLEHRGTTAWHIRRAMRWPCLATTDLPLADESYKRCQS